MSAEVVIFYILAAVIIGGALLAVTVNRIFRAAVFLLFSMIGIAGLYFYLNYEFLGAVQIVIYVGGIVVLIIFSIFLTAQSGSNMKKPGTARIVFSLLASLLGAALTFWLVYRGNFQPSLNAAIEPDARNIGRQMLSTTDFGYILPFEVVSVLLLAAMIGCIVIAIKVKPKA